jgi:hypothetical protein
VDDDVSARPVYVNSSETGERSFKIAALTASAIGALPTVPFIGSSFYKSIWLILPTWPLLSFA